MIGSVFLLPCMFVVYFMGFHIYIVYWYIVLYLAAKLQFVVVDFPHIVPVVVIVVVVVSFVIPFMVNPTSHCHLVSGSKFRPPPILGPSNLREDVKYYPRRPSRRWRKW